MESPALKRSRVTKTQKGRKRQKFHAKGINELAWKEVPLPDRLEDAEGFFGLEEIEDVQVVRDGDQVRYMVAHDEDPTDHSNDGDVTEIQGDLEDASSSSFEGFADEPNSQKDLKSVIERRPKAKRKQHETHDSSSLSNGFGVLEEFEDEGADVSAWQPLGLLEDIVLALSRIGFSNPTPIQTATIPEILDGIDVIGKASTGSGKTLAFGIPILQSFLKTRNTSANLRDSQQEKTPLALILSPTRELAHQLTTHINDLCSKLTVDGPRVATLTGGLSIHKQQRQLSQADIVVGTPGRLWEFMSSTVGALQSLQKAKFLVIDEADRLLSEGHFKEVEQILEGLDKQEVDAEERNDSDRAQNTPSLSRQTLVFSATFERDLQQKLASRKKNHLKASAAQKGSLSYLLQKLNFHSKTPKFIDVDPTLHLTANLNSGLIECGVLEKDLNLYAVLLAQPQPRTLVFTNSITSVRRLTPFLQNLNITAHQLHSEMPQKARLRSIERFSSSTASTSQGPGAVLIATDVAARGLDLPSVSLIIHYHVPRAADMYVHRSGRTARASESGTSILLCSPEEVLPVRRLVGQIHASKSSSKSSDPDNSEPTKEPTALRTLSLSRTLLSRVKPRVTLSQALVSATQSKDKANAERNWLAKAAEDLGVDYDSDEFAAAAAASGGRGRGKKAKVKVREKQAGASKEQVAAWRADLKELLGKRVNLGVSERYLTAGAGVDVGELLKEKEGGKEGVFLGVGGGIEGWED